MTININKKFIQIAIPRTASTTISDALENRTYSDPKEHHCTIKEAISKYPEAKDFYKFSFVRNPFDKLVSIYFEFRKNRKCQYSEKRVIDIELLSEFDIGVIVDHFRNNTMFGVEDIVNKAQTIHSATDTENFRNFCKNLKTSTRMKDLFFKPQFDYISIDGTNVMDYIGKFENLKEDWSHIRAEIGMAEASLGDSPKEPRGFMRGSDHPPYEEMYTEKEIEIVENLYKKDLEYFNYSF